MSMRIIRFTDGEFLSFDDVDFNTHHTAPDGKITIDWNKSYTDRHNGIKRQVFPAFTIQSVEEYA